MATQEVTTTQSSVPDLVRTPALQITAEDIALPRIYLGQFMSEAVQQQRVKPGSIFAALSGDDPDPNVLWEQGTKKPGVLFYVLGLRKGKSISEGGELQLFDYDDPNAPVDAWVTYSYTLLVPEVDTDLPCKLLLTRTGRQTALKINTVLKKNSISGPSWNSAFRLTAAPRENTKGKFFVAQATQVDAEKDHIAAAEAMASMIAVAPSPEFASRSEEPAI